ncbi:MAG TPA: Flp family type IVb pilin [Acidobacteriota bacterium]|nr:Flp family type IVb pilin [Acidobacteriota bacterium]
MQERYARRDPDGLEMLKHMLRSERGVSTSEYAVMLALVALTLVVFGSDISDAVIGAFDTLVGLLG